MGSRTPDGLTDFTKTAFTHQGVTKDLYRQGAGPAVIVMCEIPGITPEVAGFARRVAALGLTVVMPDLFGDAGRPRSGGYVLASLAKGCISKEFAAFAVDEAAPVTVWLRALAAALHQECRGPGVGAIGMCFTGGFALAMMVEPAVVAPVLSQPAAPFPIGRKRKSGLGISRADLRIVKERVSQGCPVLGLRFTADPAVPAERFDRLRKELGNGFIAVEIDSSPGNPTGLKKTAHSVVTEDLVDEPGHPTRLALDQVLSFFRDSLLR